MSVPPLVPRLAHRAEVIVLHACQSLANDCMSYILILVSLISFIIVLLNVDFGLPCFRLPSGVLMKTCRGVLLSFILSVWPMYAQRRFLMVFVMSSWFVSSRSLLLNFIAMLGRYIRVGPSN
jgi:hypothetical protein